MRQPSRPHLFALSFALGMTVKAAAQDATFTTIDFPGAMSTEASGINPRGDIVGLYTLAGVTHGFLLSGDSFTTIDPPGAVLTFAFGINPRGDIVGRYDTA